MAPTLANLLASGLFVQAPRDDSPFHLPLLYSAPPSIAGCDALLQPSRTLRLPDITASVAAAMMVLQLHSGPPALAAPALAVLTRYCSGQRAMRSPPAGVPGFPLLADGAISIIAARCAGGRSSWRPPTRSLQTPSSSS